MSFAPTPPPPSPSPPPPSPSPPPPVPAPPPPPPPPPLTAKCHECKYCTETPCRECAGCAPYVDPVVSADPICASCSADNWTPEGLAQCQPAACYTDDLTAKCQGMCTQSSLSPCVVCEFCSQCAYRNELFTNPMCLDQCVFNKPTECTLYEDPSCFPPPPPVAPAPPFTCEKCKDKPKCTECLECMPLAAPSGAEFCSDCTECPPYVPERLAPFKCSVAPLSGCTEQCQPAKCTVAPLDADCSNEYGSKVCLESTFKPCTVCEYCTTMCADAAAASTPECAICPGNTDVR